MSFATLAQAGCFQSRPQRVSGHQSTFVEQQFLPTGVRNRVEVRRQCQIAGRSRKNDDFLTF